MICDDPYVRGGGEAFPCGKCFACLAKWRKLWQHRLQLEALCHSASAFVTLTYAEDTVPKDMNLQPAEFVGFMKRLREHVWRKEKTKIRYYGVGEYGDQSARPHYHVLLFGYPSCRHGTSMYTSVRKNCCDRCDLVRDVWGLGFVGLGSVNDKSIRYVCGYMTKNMRHRHDERLKGREPEFSRKSTHPGIGYYALRGLTETLLEYALDSGKVPTHLRHGAIKKPLGRYLRGKVAEMLAMDNECVDEEVQALWQVACDQAPMGGEVRKTVFKNLLIEASEQKIVNMKTRMGMKKRAML